MTATRTEQREGGMSRRVLRKKIPRRGWMSRLFGVLWLFVATWVGTDRFANISWDMGLRPGLSLLNAAGR